MDFSKRMEQLATARAADELSDNLRSYKVIIAASKRLSEAFKDHPGAPADKGHSEELQVAFALAAVLQTYIRDNLDPTECEVTKRVLANKFST